MSAQGLAQAIEALLNDAGTRRAVLDGGHSALEKFDLDDDERQAVADGIILQVDAEGELRLANAKEAMSDIIILQSKRRYG